MPLRSSFAAALGAGAALAGCGSEAVSSLPPPAGPAGAAAPLDHGRLLAAVAPHARTLDLYDARTRRRVRSTPAGVGPTHVACLDAGPCWVTDTRGEALLVFSPARRDALKLTRRLYLPGGPTTIRLDHRRLYVTLARRHEVVELPANARPHVLRVIAHGAGA